MTIVTKDGLFGKVIRRGIIQTWYPIRSTPTKHKVRGLIVLGNIYFPKHLIGKKIQIKVEVLNDNGKPKDK